MMITAMLVTVGIRIVLILLMSLTSRYYAKQAADAEERLSSNSTFRKKSANYAMKNGFLTRQGNIRAAHVFEFNPTGPEFGWK